MFTANGDGVVPTVASTPGIRCTEKSRSTPGAVGIAVRSIRFRVSNANRHGKGEPFVSDIAHAENSFFALYDSGQATAEQIDDFVDAWHASGDEETRSLAEYLGVTNEEYGVLIITDRALPAILAARRARRPLRQFVAPFFERLRAEGDPENRPVVFALAHWLKEHAADPA